MGLGRSPADKRFGAYWSQKAQLWWQQFLLTFLRTNVIFCRKQLDIVRRVQFLTAVGDRMVYPRAETERPTYSSSAQCAFPVFPDPLEGFYVQSGEFHLSYSSYFMSYLQKVV